MIGRRLRVFCKSSKQWVEAKLRSTVHDGNGVLKYKIEYANGETKKMNLDKERFQIYIDVGYDIRVYDKDKEDWLRGIVIGSRIRKRKQRVVLEHKIEYRNGVETWLDTEAMKVQVISIRTKEKKKKRKKKKEEEEEEKERAFKVGDWVKYGVR